MFRNFFHTIRCFKASFILNVLGLAVAFAASMMIMMQVRYDLTFDTCYEDAKNIYRLDIIGDAENALLPRPFARTFSGSSPDVAASCLMYPSIRSGLYKIQGDSSGMNRAIDIWPVSSGCLDVFGFTMTEGNRSALELHGNAIIPESLAARLFNGKPATGQMLISVNGLTDLTIAGVYKDFPENASVRNVVYASISHENYDNWGNFTYMCFVRLQNECDTEYLLKNFTDNYPEIFRNDYYSFPHLKCVLRQIHDLHFISSAGFDTLPKCNPLVLYSIISIAAIILIIACINFTNFNISLAPMRARSINIRRILGDSRIRIRNMIVCEGICIYITAYLLALCITHVSGNMLAGKFIDADISLASNIPVICAGTACAIMAGLISNLYTAFYLTSAPHNITVKGNFALSPAGIRTRNILVVIQFLGGFIMITASIFLYAQNRYMMSVPLGFDKDQIIICNINGRAMDRTDALSGEIMRISGVENVCYSQYIAGNADYYMTWQWGEDEKHFEYSVLPVSPSYLKTMGIGISEGRDFRENDRTGNHDILIFNEFSKKRYGLSAGTRNNSREIVGFIPDIHFTSLRQEISPMALWLYRSTAYNYCMVRISAGTDLKDARLSIQQCLERFYPEYQCNIKFYDSILEDTYRKEQRTGKLVSLFSLIAIIISVVGVFSLVTFECGYRRKESSIRKVAGATSWELVRMFCRKYLTILGICFVISIPVSIIVVRRWFESFAYHIPLYWWVFPAVFIAIAAITLATVIWQSWSTANENPVNNLRTD